jgi:hypothetical protein
MKTLISTILLMFVNFISSQTINTTSFPNNGQNETGGGGTIAWSNPDRIVSDNTHFATFANTTNMLNSQFLKGRNYGFSLASKDIPAGIRLDI